MLGLLYSFILYLFPAVFRLISIKVNNANLSWLYKIQLPIIDKLITYRKDFKEDSNRDSMSIEELGRIRQVLIQIFNT